MRYPTLYEQEYSRDMIDTFEGYNHNLRIGANEFYDMKNLTSDRFPVLSPRTLRGVYATPEKPNGLIAKDALCYVDGTNFVINEYRIDMGFNDEPKQLISMGAYVIIMPDKKYINTLDLTEYGDIEATFVSTSDVSFQLCTREGEEYANAPASPTEPVNPNNLDLWIDTSSVPHTLKKYSSANAIWVTIPTTYIKIKSTGIGKSFAQYDGVTISGIVDETLQDLNSTMVIWDRSDNYIVVVGIISQTLGQEVASGAITVSRTMPNLDFVIESENRLWGCRYGVAANGAVVNEIYACKLGDFKNWNCFMGLSTDSYVASCGTDGQFTGAITHLGYPLFFKETCLHKVYGNFPSNYQIQTTACRGVQNGCERSLVIVNEVLYYKARSGVCAYDGSLPVEISSALGEVQYCEAVAGGHGNKYYISMKDDEKYHLFVYDSEKKMWHKEDNLQADAFCSCHGELYCIDHETKKIVALLGSGERDEQDVEWFAESGHYGMSSPDMKYVSRINIRMKLDVGAEVQVFVKYDFNEEWIPQFTVVGTSLRSFSLPIRPKRCDNMKMLIVGKGYGEIYSLTKTIEQGSDIS